MGEETVSALEAAIADAGALVLRARKYRASATGAGPDLERLLTAIGDRARRLHRRDALDEAAAAALLRETDDVTARLRAALAGVRAAPAYVEAVAALAAGDQATLARRLPEIFTDLEAVPPPPALFQTLPWLRRGRPRPAADLTAAVVAARDTGLEGEGDDLSAGTDADLPAVALVAEPPSDEPVVLRMDTAAPSTPLFRLVPTGEYLLHTRRLRAPFGVRLATAFTSDEQLRVELGPADFARWRADLAAALAAAGVPVVDG